MSPPTVTVRRAKDEDFSALVSLFHNGRKSSRVIPVDGCKDESSEELVARHLRRGYLNVCATSNSSENTEEIVAFLSFDLIPSHLLVDDSSLLIDQPMENLNPRSAALEAGNCIFLTRFVSAVKDCSLGPILRTVFLTLPMVDYILLVQEQMSLTVEDFGAKFAHVGELSGFQVFSCARQAFSQSLKCRQAKVEDYDDLIGIFNSQSEVIARRYGEFFLAQVIEGQTEHRKALVAVVDNKAVALMCVSADIDVDFLNDNFDLQDFNYLTKSLTSGTTPQQSGNCFAIVLFGIDRTHDSRAFEMIKAAFDLFPDKEHCTLSLPHDTQETALTPYFSYAPPRRCSSKRGRDPANFSHALYVFQRDSIRAFDLRYMVAETPEIPWWVNGSQLKVNHSSDRSALALAVHEALGVRCDWLMEEVEHKVFAVHVLDTLVGVVSVQHGVEEERLEALQESFELDARVATNDVVVVHNILLSPVFLKAARQIFQHILQRCSCLCLMFKLPPSAPLPTAISEEFAQVRPRPYAANKPEYDCAIFTLWKAELSLPTYRVSTRVVVAGASDAGLALLQELLLVRHICFKNLVLLTPGAVEVANPDLKHLLSNGACNGPMSRDCLGRTGILSRVRWVNGKVTGMDRRENVAFLSDNTELFFDKLILATGWSSVSIPASLGTPSPARNLFCIEADPVKGEQLLTALKKSASLEPFDPVVIYGSSVEALAAISLMTALGKAGHAITLVLPEPLTHVGFDDVVADLVTEQLRSADIRLYENASIKNSSFAEGEINAITLSNGEEISVTLLLLAGELEVDEGVCRAVNEGGAVYDAGVVVNGGLETVREGVYAIGPVARFSRRCQQTGRSLSDFDSVAIAASAAKALLRRIDPLQKMNTRNEVNETLGEDYGSEANEVSKWTAKLCCRGSMLPGGLEYFTARVPEQTERNPYSCALRRRELSTRQGLRYLRLTVNAFGFVEAVTALIPESSGIKASGLAYLVGTHVSYLNDVEGKLERGELDDLLEFFTQDWAAAMRHDGFRKLIDSMHLSLGQTIDRPLESAIQKLQEGYEGERSALDLRLLKADVVGVGGETLNAPESREVIESELAEFLRSHQSVLNMYAIGRC